MNLKKFFAAGFCLTMLIAGPSFAQGGKPTHYNAPHGLWITENGRSVIDVYDCDMGLCGKIHWIIKGGMQQDTKNPDPKARGQKMCGLPIMWGFKKVGAQSYDGGTIYKADEGETYSANIEMMPNGQMKLRGYVGVPLFGKSQIWTPVNNKDYPKCK